MAGSVESDSVIMVTMIEVNVVTSKDDIAGIVKVIGASSWSENSEINPNDYSVEVLKKCVSNEHHVFCTAMLNGEFAGMASAFILHKPDGDVLLYIDEVDVCADKQQKGVGTSLMQFLFKYGTDNKCDEVWLGTEKANVAANALYTSLKPVEVEEFIGYSFK